MSYQGARPNPPKETQQVQVKDYMTKKLVTFNPEQGMDEIIDTLLSKKISGGPVVDEDNNLVGIISEGDCMKQVIRGKYNNTFHDAGKVKDHMSTDVKTMNPGTNVFEAAQMFLEMKVRRFPIMEEGKLIGQISQRDVMQAIQNLKKQTW